MNSIELKDRIETFDELLLSDDLFLDYFNKFCELNFFPDKILYCANSKNFLITSGCEVHNNHLVSSDLAILNQEDFKDVFRKNFLKQFICSYYCLEFRISRLLSQVIFSSSSREIISKSFVNTLISNGEEIKQRTYVSKGINLNLGKNKEQNVELVDKCEEFIEECHPKNCSTEVLIFDEKASKKFPDILNPAHYNIDVNRNNNNINKNDLENIYTNILAIDVDHCNKVIGSIGKNEDQELRVSFERCEDVSEFYSFLPKETAQPLWLFWIETQKIVMMQSNFKCFDEREVGRLKLKCQSSWTRCLRLRTFLGSLDEHEGSLDQLVRAGHASLHCLLTYWVPRYLLLMKHLGTLARSPLPSSSLSSPENYFSVLNRYCSLHKIPFKHGLTNFFKFEITSRSASDLFRTGTFHRSIKCGTDNNMKEQHCMMRKSISCVIRKFHRSITAHPHRLNGSDKRHQRENVKQIIALDRFLGGGFYRFLKESKNEDMLNNYCFLKECQEFRSLSQISHLMKAASEIYARFITSGSRAKLDSVCENDALKIHSNLLFPHEELFETIENQVEEVLTSAVQEFKRNMKESLSELRLESEQDDKGDVDENFPEFKKSNSIKENHALRLPRSLKLKPSKATSLTTLNDLCRDRNEMENFKNFLIKQNSATELHFWQDIKNFKHLAENSEEQRNKAEEIFSLYVNERYYLGHDSPASKQQLEQNRMKFFEYNPVLADIKTVSSFLDEAQSHVEKRLEKKWIPLYITRRNNVKIDVADGKKISISSNQRNETVFRNMLSDNAMVDNFIQFVGLNYESHEMDVQFLAEVKKYERTVLMALSKCFDEFEGLKKQMNDQQQFPHLSEQKKKKQALSTRSKFKKYGRKQSTEEFKIFQRGSNIAHEGLEFQSNKNLISWTYSEYMVNLLNDKLREAQHTNRRQN